MEIEREYRTVWGMPRACCRCVEPVSGTRVFAAASQATYRTRLETIESKLKLEFPVCDACAAAQSGSHRAIGLGGLAGLAVFAGLFSLTLAWDLGEVASWLLCGGLLVLLAVLGGSGMAVGRIVWNSMHDVDARQRADLPAVPVTLAPVGTPPAYDAVRFTFANEDFGRMFDAANPDPAPAP